MGRINILSNIINTATIRIKNFILRPIIKSEAVLSACIG